MPNDKGLQFSSTYSSVLRAFEALLVLSMEIQDYLALRNFDFFRKSQLGKGEMKNQLQFRDQRQILYTRRSSSLKFEEKQILTSLA